MYPHDRNSSTRLTLKPQPPLLFLVHGLSRDSQLVCFGCYGSLDDEDPFACEGCGLPLCTENCQKQPQHQPECAAFRSLGLEAGRNLSMSLLSDTPTLHDAVMILRCLNLRQAPDDEWFKLNQVSVFFYEFTKENSLKIFNNFQKLKFFRTLWCVHDIISRKIDIGMVVNEEFVDSCNREFINS